MSKSFPGLPANPRLSRRLSGVAMAVAVVVALAGASHLVAWLSGCMADLGIIAITMKTNSALCLTLSGIGLMLLIREQTHPVRLWIARTAAVIVMIVGMLTLSENVFGWNLGIDQLLAKESPGAMAVIHPNQMGIPASTSFTLAGLSLLIISRRRHSWLSAAQGLALGICLIGMFGTVGYLYGVESFYGIARYTGIAWPTATAFLLLGLGLLLSRSAYGLMAQVVADDPGGANLRRWLPVLLLPVPLGWLRLSGERSGLFDPATGTAIAMIVFIVFLLVLAYVGARPVSHYAFERDTAAEFLNNVNQATGSRELLRMAAEFLHQHSRCEAVGIRLAEGDDFPYWEVRGFPPEFVKLENSLCVRDADGKVQRDDVGDPCLACMCGNVICGRFDATKEFFTSNGSFWTNSTTRLLAGTSEADRQSRTRNQCNGQGYESVALIPLRAGQQRLGLVQINDKRKGMFTPRLIALWERLAAHLGVALGKLLAEEALRISEASYRGLFENMLNGLAHCRMIYEDGRPSDFVYLSVNKAFETLTGLKNVAGRKASEAIPGIRESDPELIEKYGRVTRTGKPEVFEAYVDALKNWFAISAYSPEPDHFVAVFDVITERKRAEEALRQSEDRFRTLANTIPQLAWSANPDGYITWYNDNWYKYTGTTPQHMEGWGWQSVHDPVELPKVLERWKVSIATGQPFDMVFPLRGADGIFRPFLTRVQPLKDSAGRVLQWFGTNTDVEELKRTEDALRRIADELARSNRELEQFAYISAHDLQEPLRQVQAFVNLLTDKYGNTFDVNAAQYFQFVCDGAARMSQLVRGLLEYSRVGARDVRRQPISCQKALDTALANIQASIAESSAAITRDELPTVVADPTQLSQLFQNLIGNAMKFRRKDAAPAVHVGCRRDGDQWVFSVKDNGIGIDKEFHEKVFLIFQRLHGRDDYPGTGIGLAICKKIVEQHGGRIWIESEPGQGSTFYFTLPEGCT